LRVHAELIHMAGRMRGFRGGDQQLAGHAANPCTGRAVGPALNQNDLVGMLAGLVVCHQSGGAGPDDGNVDFEFLRCIAHVISFRVFCQRHARHPRSW